ncbi:MAG: hypothetical protein GX957_03885 [Clostridiaceae bacterium]|nr:hypothetical protein [Clostridiaceae bacterium]
MNKKTVSISLPQIEGIELKNATVDLEKGVVVAEYGQEEDLCITVKKGDFLTCLSDPSKTVIFNAMDDVLGGVNTFTILYDLPMRINGKLAYTPIGTKFPLSDFRYSTEEEKALMIEEMEKLGKRYNPRTFRIEDIEKDISEIALGFGGAVHYLLEDIHTFYLPTTKKHMPKLDALNQLIILAEAWNKFDEFKPDWEDSTQDKYYVLFSSDEGNISVWGTTKICSLLDTHTSHFAFKTPERAEQFGKQFIDLFRIVLTN